MAPSCTTVGGVSAVWWILLGLGPVGSVLLYLAGRRVSRELAALRESTGALQAVRPAVAEVGRVAERTRRAVEIKDLR
jgi:hypothetical protein